MITVISLLFIPDSRLISCDTLFEKNNRSPSAVTNKQTLLHQLALQVPLGDNFTARKQRQAAANTLPLFIRDGYNLPNDDAVMQYLIREISSLCRSVEGKKLILFAQLEHQAPDRMIPIEIGFDVAAARVNRHARNVLTEAITNYEEAPIIVQEVQRQGFFFVSHRHRSTVDDEIAILFVQRMMWMQLRSSRHRSL